jgi:CO dehydrogenase nickel-insertion accessory protein CooC1
VIFVTSFDALLTEPECEFLQEAAGYVEKIFLVVNKLDLVTRSEREEILAVVEERASAAVGVPSLPAVALSAGQGLAAKVARDETRLLHSGLPDFEGQLLRFLAADKGGSSCSGWPAAPPS